MTSQKPQQPQQPEFQPEEFDWIMLSKNIQPDQETFQQKFWRKVSGNPLVPVGMFHPKMSIGWNATDWLHRYLFLSGALGALGALGYGLYSMRQGDQRKSQLMVRVRLV